MPTLKITRIELHELVWSKTMRDSATQLGMSDVGVAKLCKRNNVPRPTGGYWLRAHKRKQPPPLKGEDKLIIVYLRDKLPKSERLDIEIPETSASARAHKEVVRCRSDLKGAQPDNYGRLISQRKDMEVSRKSLPRALSLMNQIIRTALLLGYQADTQDNGVLLAHDGEPIRFGFYEHSTRSRGKVRYGTYETIQQIYTPSGQLKFSLLGVYGLHGTQREWSDRPNNQLESQVHSIMRGILTATENLKVQRIEQAEQQRRYQIERRFAKRQARIDKLTRERQLRALRLIENWQRSNEITAFLDAIDGHELSPQAARLIRWVSDDLAQHYDPFDQFTIPALDEKKS